MRRNSGNANFWARKVLAGTLALASAALLACCGTKTNSSKTYEKCKLAALSGSQAAIGGFPRNSNRLASTGTVRATVIFVDFPNSPATLTPAQAFAKVSGATATFDEQSYGRLQYSMTPHLTWFRMSGNSNSYTLSTSGGQLAYIQEAVTLADPAVNFASTDSLIVIANPSDSGIGTSGPAFLRPAGSGVTADGREMRNAATSAYDLNTWGSIWLNHEVGHTLGLVDLYASTTLNPSNPNDVVRYTGEFSYMGKNSFASNSPGLTAWERWVLGWLDDSQIQCSAPKLGAPISAFLTAIQDSGGMKALVVPLGGTKVLVVESRRKKGLDAAMKKEGALVYTVDSSIDTGKGPMQVYPINASDTLYLEATRAAGESVTVGNLKVEVVNSSPSGDVVRISGEP